MTYENDMLKSFIKVALRKMNRQKFYSGLNILGLTIGIAGAIFILLWVQDEKNFDKFHKNADRIFRVYQTFRFDDRHIEQTQTPSVLAQTIREKCPEVEMATNVRGFRGENLIEVGDKKFNEKGLGIADEYFFRFFSFPLIYGNMETVLNEPFTIAISENTAKKYFGDSLALGRSVKIFNDQFTIAGIYKDMPDQSHFHLDVLMSFSTYYGSQEPNWGINSFKTYVLLREGSKLNNLERNLEEIVRDHLFETPEVYQQVLDAGNFKKFPVQALTDIHLKSNLLWEFEANGNAMYVKFFTIIAIFILIIAIINYINLSTARSAKRVKEVGLRKAIGSSRSLLIRQFLTESILMSIISMLLALLTLHLLMPAFRNMIGKEWLINPFEGNTLLQLCMILLALLIGIIAGIYPSLVLSSFNPIKTISGNTNKWAKGSVLRNSLVVFQFFISVMLLIMTLVVQKQMNFIQNKNPGCNIERVIVIKTYGEIVPKLEILKETLKKNNMIVSVSASSSLPGKSFTNIGMGLEGGKHSNGTNMYIADADFQKTLQIEMLEGRFFDNNISSDGQAVVINEVLAKQLAVDNLLEKRMMIWVGGEGNEPFQIIGIVKNFHYESFHEQVKPLAIVKLNGTCPWQEEYLSIKIKTSSLDKSLKHIQESWNNILPGVPFNYDFLDSIYESQYQNEKRTGHVFKLFTVFMIFVSCLGLLGMASFTVENRTKEIAIRKVMGASINRILFMLTSNFVRWAILANLLAWPVSYFFMTRWLNQFSYRIEIDIWPFLNATIIILLITLFTITFHAFKASFKNPVNSLRYE
jgi:putative ABC transport system permease protein